MTQLAPTQSFPLEVLLAHLNGTAATRTWRTLGSMLDTERLRRILTDGVEHSFVVCDNHGAPLGLVELIHGDDSARRAELSVLSWAGRRRDGRVAGAIVAALGLWFAKFDLSCVHAMVISGQYRTVERTLRRFFRFDGVLRQWVTIDEEPTDVHVFSLTASEYHTQVGASPLLQRIISDVEIVPSSPLAFRA